MAECMARMLRGMYEILVKVRPKVVCVAPAETRWRRKSFKIDFCPVHETPGTPPAIAAGLTDHVWTVAELLSAN